MSFSVANARVILAVICVTLTGTLLILSRTTGGYLNTPLYLDFDKLAAMTTTSGLTMPSPVEDNKTDTNNTQAAAMVLIVTYMRSGSSFTGELFHVNPHALYIFEPLFHLFWSGGSLKIMNGSVLNAKSGAAKKTMAHEVIRNFFTCRVKDIFLKAFRSHLGREKDSRGLVCKGNLNTKCVAKFAEFCENSRLRSIKTIRLSLDDTIRLIENLPTLKILHLLRDPRGIMTSRSKMRHTYALGANKLCQQMRTDLSIYQEYAARYPARFMQILYEDIAEDTLSVAGNIYNFLNMELPVEVTNWIKTQASGGNVEERTFSTRRRNSSETASKWRLSIPWELSTFIDKQCFYVYNKLGYIAFQNEKELRNLNIPSRLHVK